MGSPERPGGVSPEGAQPSYHHAARFSGERPARQAYNKAQGAIYGYEPDCDLSAYRLRINQVWHVAVVGTPPPDDLDEQLRAILSGAEALTLPPEMLAMLQKRRAEATQLGPWVEGHYRSGKRLG